MSCGSLWRPDRRLRWPPCSAGPIDRNRVSVSRSSCAGRTRIGRLRRRTWYRVLVVGLLSRAGESWRSREGAARRAAREANVQRGRLRPSLWGQVGLRKKVSHPARFAASPPPLRGTARSGYRYVVETFWRARQIFSGVTGIWMSASPRASRTALSTAGVDPMAPASPIPFAPNGLVGVGVTVPASRNDGREVAVGTKEAVSDALTRLPSSS